MIDLGLFRENIDVDVLAAGVVFADRAFRSHHVVDQVVQRISPPASLNMDEPEQVRLYVKDQVLIFNHLLGTCALGKVVDDRLGVKGVRGLRVVDASVIPIQMSGNIIATVYAIAERAADMIKQDANSA
jgi:choline dehydrogenase-like flavoprotein